MVHEHRGDSRDDEGRQSRKGKGEGDAEEFPDVAHSIELSRLIDIGRNLTHLIRIDKGRRPEVDEGIEKNNRDIGGLSIGCQNIDDLIRG